MTKKVCVYCGSRTPDDSELKKTADQLGNAFARHRWALVYGGGKVGMMGIIADACLNGGGEVIGVIPTALKRAEVAHSGVSELIETPDMHTRKAKMEELSDAFVVLPGGFGTLDEFFEILTWKQLGFHQKPIILVNQNGYFDGLKVFVERAIADGFIRKENLGLFQLTSSFDETMELLESHLLF